MQDADVIIVGAGLTGLRAASELIRAGLSVLVVERGESVGGRMRTTPHNGFLLDHGFQVILGAYPELKTIPNFDSLACRAFDSGARVRWNGAFHDFMDIRRHPSSIRLLFSSPLFSLADLARLFAYAELSSRSHPRPSSETTAESLRRYRFSDPFRERFLKPFLASVLLDPTLSLDAAVARFYLKTFSEGSALLPKQGIQALPNLLAQQVGVSHILLRSKVQALREREVVLDSGEVLGCTKVLCCTDILSAAQMGGPEQTMPQRASRTVYYGADAPPFAEPLVALNGEGRGLISNVNVLTNVQPSYAPAGKALIAVTVIGDDALTAEANTHQTLRSELGEWFGASVHDWEHLHTFSVPHSLPARPRLELGARQHNGIMFAGDYLSYGSQNGALRAGREAARLVLESFEREVEDIGLAGRYTLRSTIAERAGR